MPQARVLCIGSERWAKAMLICEPRQHPPSMPDETFRGIAFGKNNFQIRINGRHWNVSDSHACFLIKQNGAG